jgi:hypothetical protein
MSIIFLSFVDNNSSVIRLFLAAIEPGKYDVKILYISAFA